MAQSPEQFAAIQRQIARTAERNFRDLVRIRQATGRDLGPDIFDDLVRRVVARHGAASARHAQAWYQSLRPADLPWYRPDMEAGFTAEQLTLALEPAAAASNPGRQLLRVVDRAVLQAGRDTIREGARRDPAAPRWVRKPVGVTCAWCLMQTSRSLGFTSEHRDAAADLRAREPDRSHRFHERCDCTLVPIFPGQRSPIADESHVLRLWDDAREVAAHATGAANPSTSQILAALRREHPGVLSDGVPSRG